MLLLQTQLCFGIWQVNNKEIKLIKMLRFFFQPYKYRLINKNIKQDKPLTILDVGCGHASYQICSKYLRIDRFDGIDKHIYNGKDEDYKSISNMYFIDLEEEVDKIESLPDNFYDLIILSHIIEHIQNGEEVIALLANKVKQNGLIYVETPSVKTLKYPSGKGFFNFHDDPTHKKIYFFPDLANLFFSKNFKVIKAGIRRDMVRLIFYTPIYLIYNLFYHLPIKGKWDVRGLWDFFGIAQFVLAKNTK